MIPFENYKEIEDELEMMDAILKAVHKDTQGRIRFVNMAERLKDIERCRHNIKLLFKLVAEGNLNTDHLFVLEMIRGYTLMLSLNPGVKVPEIDNQ